MPIDNERLFVYNVVEVKKKCSFVGEYIMTHIGAFVNRKIKKIMRSQGNIWETKSSVHMHEDEVIQ